MKAVKPNPKFVAPAHKRPYYDFGMRKENGYEILY